MHRFNTGDAVLILQRFAHLYPNDFGVIVAVKIDPYRSAFNEYAVKFPDGSTASLFEFQLVEEGSLERFGRVLPSSQRRGGCASKKMSRSLRSGADGVVAHKPSLEHIRKYGL